MVTKFFYNRTMSYFFVFFILACTSNRDNLNRNIKISVENILNTTLLIPERISINKAHNCLIADSNVIANSEYKIYTHINADCATCIRDIKNWQTLIPVFKKFNVPVIFICGSEKGFNFLNYLVEDDEFDMIPYILLLDNDNEFIELNSFMNEFEQFKTVLTDKTNKILLLGSPNSTIEMRDMYLKEIKKRIKQN